MYFMIDVSGSMDGAIAAAMELIAQFIQAIPLDKVHAAIFNTHGREIEIKHASTAGVRAAFRGIGAGGGTDYRAGVFALKDHKPEPGEDALFIFVGDQQAQTFKKEVEASGLNPTAFGLVYVKGKFGDQRAAVDQTAASLGIPCFHIDSRTFEGDPYAIPRTIQALIAATPVGERAVVRRAAKRVTLVDTIIGTDLLQKPTWAA